MNVFEVFLPQLLLYPNPADPLNGEAAALLMRDPPAFERKVKDYVARFAQPAAVAGAGAGARGGHANGNGHAADASDDEADAYVSSDDDDEAAGKMDAT